MLTKNSNTGKMSESLTKPPAKLTRKVADAMADSGSTPLDVMIDNMLFWRNQAHNLQAVLVEKIRDLHPADSLPDPQARIEAERRFNDSVLQIKEVSNHFLTARENAQRCAVDAAPYVNARIAPTKLDGADRTAAKLISKQTPPVEAMAAYLDSLRIVSIEADPPGDDDADPYPAEPTADLAS